MARVLVVDDERLTQQLLARVLGAEGHSPAVVGSVLEARKITEALLRRGER